MNAPDHNLRRAPRKLEDLEAIEAQLAHQETKVCTTLIVGMVLATMGFALLLGHHVSPSWLPLERRISILSEQ
jgi:hypothetical protein